MISVEDKKGDGVHYLWHLEQVGCIDESHELTEAWKLFLTKELPGDATVAIIDNGCSLSHPNLDPFVGAIQDPIEFSSYVQGAVFSDDPNSDKATRFAGIRDFLSELGLKCDADIDVYLGNGISENLRSTIKEYFAGTAAPVELKIPSPSERFAAHGTSCAGLIAGRPEVNDSEEKVRNPSALDYFGVNPFSSIIPVSTVYSHAYWPMVMGLLYAAAQQPDAILIPRAIEEMKDPAIYESHEGGGVGDESDPRDNGNLRSLERWAEKQLFEKLLAEVSDRIPVVVAAGNSGGVELEYPAKLVDAGAPSLIVVGAVTANALRATYSSGHDPDAKGAERHKVTVYAPSDDREETSADNFRIFDLAWRSRRLSLDRFEGAVSEAEAFDRYAPYGVLSLDIAGQYGYDSSSEADLDFREDRTDPELKKVLAYPETLPRALYTLFGGTSAASSVVAGVVSLLKATEQGADLSGAEIKALLEKARFKTSIAAVIRDESFPRPLALRTESEEEESDTLPGLNLSILLSELGIIDEAAETVD